jgi:membrane protease YdiL (CAAX protease family)
MWIPSNWFTRLFIKKKYLPRKVKVPAPIRYFFLALFYPFHIVGLALIGFVMGLAHIMHYLGLGVLYVFHYIELGVKYFFYYIGLLVLISGKRMFVTGKRSHKWLKRVFEWLKRWINWILIIITASVAFIIWPINLPERILYTFAFATLGFMTWLLREELGFIGRAINKVVAFVNTRKGLFFIIPLFLFGTSEMLLINSVENIVLFYVFCTMFFLIFAAVSSEPVHRNYWGILIVPTVLRMVNLSLPFPIINSKLQLFLTYGVITYSAFLFAKYMGLRMDFFRGSSIKQYIIAILAGLGLGTIEYFILGFVPIIQTLTIIDYTYLMFTIFIIGFGEELIYRGLVQVSQQELFGPKTALFLTSVLFGIMHLIWRDPLEFFFTTAAGFIFGYQFYKTKSIVPPTIAHIVNNTTWLILSPVIGL